MKRKRYPTDLTDNEWGLIEELFKVSYSKGGRFPKHSKREIINAIFIYSEQDVSGDTYLMTFHHGRQSILIYEIGRQPACLKK